jgi:hypothetical protein
VTTRNCKEEKESCKKDEESNLSDLNLKSVRPMPSLNITNDFNPCAERPIENKCLKITLSLLMLQQMDF